MARAASGLEVGTVFHGYRLDSVLGRGGMGAVYLATHVRLERKAALKVLLPELAEDEGFRERFIRESQLAASLEHPNIVPVYDSDEEDGVLYLAMRFIEGEDLGSVIRREGALEPEHALSLVEQTGSALDAAHASGLVHRDVKPANILIGQPGTHVYLTDFGVAKRMEAPGLTRTGFFVGTLDYCAPEQIEGKAVDARTDIYALGGVLFHCLAGRPPYEKDSDVAVITAHLLDPPPTLSSHRADLPPALDAVIEKAMAKSPDDRYQTCGALVQAAREALTGLRSTDVAGAPPTVRSTAPAPTAEAQPPEAPAAETQQAASPAETEAATLPPAARRLPMPRRALGIGGALALAATAAVVAVLLTRGSSSTTQPPARPVPATSALPRLASAGGTVFVTNPNGRLAQLDPTSLASTGSIPDPAHPRAMVASGSRIVTADDRTVTIYRTPNFTPVAAVGFGPHPILAAGAANAPVAVARSTGTSGGRICVVSGRTLKPCANIVGFAPSGLGVASGGRVFVANANAGTVELLTAKGDQLIPGFAHDSGAQPGGRLIASGTNLYVPVANGVAVHDLATGSLRKTIVLGAHPSDIWIASTGRLFAVLPSLGKVAVVDVGAPASKPREIRVGTGAVTLGGGRLPSGGEAVYLANLEKGTVTRLDPRTGRVIASRSIEALRAKTPPALRASDVTFTSSGRTVTAVIHLSGGTLPAESLVTKDARIGRGSASVALWQGGILANVSVRKSSGIKVSLRPEAGRLLVSAIAKRGSFVHLDVALGAGGRSVSLVFRKAAPKQITPQPSPPASPTPPVSPQPPTPPPTIG